MTHRHRRRRRAAVLFVAAAPAILLLSLAPDAPSSFSCSGFAAPPPVVVVGIGRLSPLPLATSTSTSHPPLLLFALPGSSSTEGGGAVSAAEEEEKEEKEEEEEHRGLLLSTGIAAEAAATAATDVTAGLVVVSRPQPQPPPPPPRGDERERGRGLLLDVGAIIGNDGAAIRDDDGVVGDDPIDSLSSRRGGIGGGRRRALSSLLLMGGPPALFVGMGFPGFVAPAAFADDDRPAATRSAGVVENDGGPPPGVECRDGRIVSESAVPGAYQQACMNLDERSFRLESTGDVITVYQGTNASGGMAGRTGVAVWNSGVLLTRLLDRMSISNTSLFGGKSVLELGCGAGLASVAASRLGASSVLATDSNPEVLALARRNVERNNDNNGGASSSSDAVVRTTELRWGAMDAAEHEGSADVVIGSDLTYNSGSWLALAETMATVLRPDGIVIYLTLGHSGFNVGGELGGFLSVAENMGLRLLTKNDKEYEDKVGSRAVDELLASVIAPEERGVVDANGGARAVILARKKFGRKG